MDDWVSLHHCMLLLCPPSFHIPWIGSSCMHALRRTPCSTIGQNRIYTVYIRYFWQGNHHMYGAYIRFWPTLQMMHSTGSSTCTRAWLGGTCRNYDPPPLVLADL